MLLQPILLGGKILYAKLVSPICYEEYIAMIVAKAFIALSNVYEVAQIQH